MEQKKRILWIDVIKFFGIFAIYIGYFAEYVGLSYHFVFSYHVPLFFLISGCMESLKVEQKVFQCIKDKAKNLLVPFYVFAIMSIIIHMLVSASSIDALKNLLLHTLSGVIRNRFIANSLWFLTCLFVISVLFSVIRKVKNKILIFFIGIFMYIIAVKVMNPNPIETPSLAYNVDSAIYYMLYYIIGYVTFGNILSLFELDCIWKKLFFGMSGIITGIYSVLLFFEIDVLKALEAVVFMEMFVPVIRALLVIWFNFILAYLCRNAVLLAEFGRSTLYLCGSEYLIKTIVPVIANILGLQIVPNGPLAIYIYCLFLIYFVYKFLAPVEKEIIKKVQNILQLQF